MTLYLSTTLERSSQHKDGVLVLVPMLKKILQLPKQFNDEYKIITVCIVRVCTKCLRISYIRLYISLHQSKTPGKLWTRRNCNISPALYATLQKQFYIMYQEGNTIETNSKGIFWINVSAIFRLLGSKYKYSLHVF